MLPQRLRLYLLWTLVATAWWTAYAWVSAVRTQQTLRVSGDLATAWDLLPGELVVALPWVPVTVFALWLADRFPIGGPRWWAIPVQAGGLVVAIAARAAALAALKPKIGWWLDFPTTRELLTYHLQIDAFTYGLIVAAAHAVYYARAHRLRERQLARAELAALRAQLQPHFLFNALNTIAALVPEDPDKADRMIIGLASMLRRSLESDGRLEVPLHTELDVLSSYLDIEQARFEDRLKVAWRVQPEARNALVPPLVLQPLVENAIRHGLSPRAAAGTLWLTADRHGDWLRLGVADDGLGLTDGAPRDGIGLANTRARLKQVYGDRHEFTIAPRDGGGVTATIAVPYRTGGHA
jgi:two-component system LytT family sensor kinase